MSVTGFGCAIAEMRVAGGCDGTLFICEKTNSSIISRQQLSGKVVAQLEATTTKLAHLGYLRQCFMGRKTNQIANQTPGASCRSTISSHEDIGETALSAATHEN